MTDIPDTVNAQSVHPHMRGENAGGSGGGSIMFGSPPHAWGKSAQGCASAVE